MLWHNVGISPLPVFPDLSVAYLWPPIQRGRSTYYTVNTVGACGFGNYRDIWTFAPNTGFFNGSNTCGSCFEVSGPLGTHVFMAADECPSSSNQQWCSNDMTHFDLDSRAFPALAPSSWGVTYTQVRPIVCPTTDPVAVIIGWSSAAYSQNYLQVYIFNHKVPIDSVEVTDASGAPFTTLSRTTYNAWEWSSPNIIVYPVMYRIRSIYNEYISVNVSSAPTALGQRFNGTQQFTQWSTAATNVCPTMYEYDIYVNGLNSGGTRQTAENWQTDTGVNLSFTASLPSNATLAAQQSMNGYAEWGFYTPGAAVPDTEIAGIELQVYSAASNPGIQLAWGSYANGNIVNLPTITSTWTYLYFPKADFGASLSNVSSLALKNSLSTTANGVTIANLRLVPTGSVVEPRTFFHVAQCPKGARGTLCFGANISTF